jgi:hypothetical protein
MNEDSVRTLVEEINPHRLKGKIALIRGALDELRQMLESHDREGQLLRSFDEIENKIENYLSTIQDALDRLHKATKDT